MRSWLCLFGSLVMAGCASTPSHDLPSVLAAQEDALLDGARSARIVVLKGSKPIVETSFGEVAGGGLPKADNLFAVGSVSKLLTATAVMQLADKGAVDLDAPLVQYLPELRIRPYPGDPKAQVASITVRQVLHHHAGFPTDHYHRLVGPDRYHFRDYLSALETEHLASRPGEVYTYSNVGYVVLGLLIERVAEKTFAEVMQETVMGPAGMTRSTFELQPEDRARLAPLPDDEALQELAVTPAGGLWSNADDVARFGRAFLDGKLIGEAQRREMWRVQTDLPIDGGFRQGLGWYRFDAPLDVGAVWGHNGATLQSRSTLLVAPEHDLVVAVVAAGVVDTSAPAMRILAAAAGKPFRAPAVEPVEVGALAGRWQAGDFGSLVLEADSDGALTTEFAGYTVKLGPAEGGGYEPSVELLGFISIQPGIFKGQRYTFARIDDEDTIINLRGGAAVTGGFRVEGGTSEAWRQRAGTWAITNEAKPIYSGFELLVASDDTLILRADFGGEATIDYAMEVVDDTHARVAGRGRDLGMVLRAEADGTMVFSGFRLQRR